MRLRVPPAVALSLTGAILTLASALIVAVPRPVDPSDIPLPTIDGAALEARARADADLAAEARATPLDEKVRALGSALRELNLLQRRAQGKDAEANRARGAVDEIFPVAREAGGGRGLARLRAVQLESFLGELRRYDATGKVSDELAAVGGTFVERVRAAGWVDSAGHVLLDEHERRVAFLLAWNAAAGADRIPELAPTLDEQRVLFALYLRLPHPPDAALARAAEARKAARAPADCAAADADVRRATERWRLDRVTRLAQVDPTYPGEYAMGVASFRAGDRPGAAAHLEAFLRQHPDGPYALRARAHLRATNAAHGELPEPPPPR